MASGVRDSPRQDDGPCSCNEWPCSGGVTGPTADTSSRQIRHGEAGSDASILTSPSRRFQYSPSSGTTPEKGIDNGW